MGWFSQKNKSKEEELPKKDNQEKEVVPIEEPIEVKFERLIIRNPGIALNKNELCLFFANAYVGKMRSRTVGYKTSGTSASMKVLGMRVHAGETKVNRQKEEYWEKTPCRFFVTGDRFIALADKGGFSIKVNKILDIKNYSDATVFYCENKTHTVFMTHEDMKRYMNMWQIVREAKEAELDTTLFL